MSILENRSRHVLAALAVPAILVACGGSTSSRVGTGSATDDAGTVGAGSTGGTSTGGTSNGGGTSTPVSGGSDDAGGGATTPPAVDSGPVDASACEATPSEVVMVGDSYFALSGEITAHLESLAVAGGDLASGASYRHYYASGANMYPYPTSTITPIPTQFANAVSANADVKYVIMDGGGNDILLQNPQCIEVSPDAGPISAECVTVIQNALTTATTLLKSMQAAGVEKVIYFFYPHLPTTGKPSVNVIMDYAYPLIQQVCASSPIPCYFIDTRPSFEGHADYIGPDNIHPTTAGSDTIATLIWGVMQQECVAL